RHVDGRRRCFADLEVLRITNQADDLQQVSVAIKLFADDTLARKKAPGERFIHHHGGRIRAQITPSEVASFQQTNSHRVEKAGSTAELVRLAGIRAAGNLALGEPLV